MLKYKRKFGALFFIRTNQNKTDMKTKITKFAKSLFVSALATVVAMIFLTT
jgi:hypothetical protein